MSASSLIAGVLPEHVLRHNASSIFRFYKTHVIQGQSQHWLCPFLLVISFDNLHSLRFIQTQQLQVLCAAYEKHAPFTFDEIAEKNYSASNKGQKRF
jgi:hypothetical protein